MLEIKYVYKSFDGTHAVQNLSLLLQSGKVTSLIGPNGAGKTTLFDIITGFVLPNKGNVLYNSDPLLNIRPEKIAQLGIGRTFQSLRLFMKMTVLENVLIGRQNQSGESLLYALFSFSKNSTEHKHHLEKTKSILEFVGLADYKNELAKNLSYGQQKLLSIACCLSTEPQLLLLDEPVSGIQPAMIEKIIYILKHVTEKENRTVFLVEHDIDFVLRVSDFVVVMDNGKKIAEGTPAVIKTNPEILEAYLS